MVHIRGFVIASESSDLPFGSASFVFTDQLRFRACNTGDKEQTELRINSLSAEWENRIRRELPRWARLHGGSFFYSAEVPSSFTLDLFFRVTIVARSKEQARGRLEELSNDFVARAPAFDWAESVGRIPGRR